MCADITRLLDAERESRQRNKRRRTARQVQAELRMYARYINEERRTHTVYPHADFPPLPAGEVPAGWRGCIPPLL